MRISLLKPAIAAATLAADPNLPAARVLAVEHEAIVEAIRRFLPSQATVN